MTNFTEFWIAFPGKKVAKPKCQQKYDKLSDDEHKQVMLAIQGQSRYRQAAAKSGEWIADWVNSQTFINQSRWYDEIPSHSALQERAAAKLCVVEGCTEPVHAPTDKLGSKYCIYHYSVDASGKLRDNMRLVPELRHHYARNVQIHDLRDQAALKYIKYKLANIGK